MTIITATITVIIITTIIRIITVIITTAGETLSAPPLLMHRLSAKAGLGHLLEASVQGLDDRLSDRKNQKCTSKGI